MNNVIDAYHLQAGTKQDPLVNPQVLKYTDSCWLQEFINAMCKFRVQIYRPHTLVLHFNRENDANIMDTLILHEYGDTDLRILNTCRQFLMVINLSDIVDVSGKQLDPGYFSNRQHDSSFIWAKVPRPPERTWQKWINAITSVFCIKKIVSSLNLNFIWENGF